MTREPLRAISIQQPYAELILRGLKDVENRSWATKHRGRLLIHAAGNVDRQVMERQGFAVEDLPRGALVGVVDLRDCTTRRGSNWHLSGQQGWYLADPRRFSRSVPFSGNVGLLKVPVRLVRQALLGARRPDPVLTIFSFGYSGWGAKVQRLIRIVDAVEAARGFEPPVFVDIRIKRAVRAPGFRDDALKRLLGFSRYRWFRRSGMSRRPCGLAGGNGSEPRARPCDDRPYVREAGMPLYPVRLGSSSLKVPSA